MHQQTRCPPPLRKRHHRMRPWPRVRALRTAAAWTLGLAPLAACGSLADTPVGIDRTEESAIRNAVSPVVANLLDRNGRFPVAPTNLPADHLSGGQAQRFARQFGRQFGPMLSEGLEHERGAPIRFHKLEPCGRPLFAHSPYEALPATAPRLLRLAVGPHWLVTLCDPAGPAIGVAVAALATDVSLQNGRLMLPGGQGGGFVPRGIPSAVESEVLSPERAAVAIAAMTGRHVSAVPELIGPRYGRSPHNSAWRVTLEAPAQVRTSRGAVRQVTELFARMRLQTRDNISILVAEEEQPAIEDVRIPLWEGVVDGQPVPYTTVRLTRRAGVPHNLVLAQED